MPDDTWFEDYERKQRNKEIEKRLPTMPANVAAQAVNEFFNKVSVFALWELILRGGPFKFDLQLALDNPATKPDAARLHMQLNEDGTAEISLIKPEESGAIWLEQAAQAEWAGKDPMMAWTCDIGAMRKIFGLDPLVPAAAEDSAEGEVGGIASL
jgi:hypothetical protein